MTDSEFIRAVEHEISWLKYYALGRDLLTTESNLYRDLISIGYTKRVIPLYDRCPWCIVTSDHLINETTPVSKLTLIRERRAIDRNRFTPLEVFWMKETNRDWVIEMLNS